jgi:hypothetical protein
MVMGHKIRSLSNPGFKPGTFQSMAQRAYQLRYQLILTPANQLMVIRLKIWLLFNTGFQQGTFLQLILTPANQLMVMGIIIWSLSNPGFEPETFQSMAQRAYQLRLLGQQNTPNPLPTHTDTSEPVDGNGA